LSIADNVNREVFALLGDMEPELQPAENEGSEEDEEQQKATKAKLKIPKMDRPVDKWVLAPFTNPAR
jgi:hypothetical protein